MGEKMNKNKLKQMVLTVLFIIAVVLGDYFNIGKENQTDNIAGNNKISYEISNIPEYNGQAYVEINNNNPNFTAEDINLETDYYSTLKDEKVRNGNDKNLLGESKCR